MVRVKFWRYGLGEEKWGATHPLHRTDNRQLYDTSITEEEEEEEYAWTSKSKRYNIARHLLTVKKE